MFDIDKIPFMPDRKPDGAFPPEKPRYTMTEEVEQTAREMRNMIDRLMKFENRLNSKVDDMLKHITSDNVIFKNTFAEAYNTFLMEVKNEVNAFEGNVDSTVALFQKNLESDYATLSEDCRSQIAGYFKDFLEELNKYKDTLNTTYDDFRATIEARIDQHNTTNVTAFNEYVVSVNAKIASIERQFNVAYSNFVDQVTASVETFKMNWSKTIDARLDSQDATIKDSIAYFKAAFASNFADMIADMKESGELGGMIESIMSAYATPTAYGAVGDGLTNDTDAFVACINSGNKFIVIPDGTYLISPITFNPNTTLIVGNATFKRATHGDGKALLKFLAFCTIHGNLTVDGDSGNTTATNENGIEFGNCNISTGYIFVHSCARHGIVIEGNANNHNFLEAYNNGKNGDANGGGSGDGVYVLNATNVTIDRCVCTSNSRMGLTVTTYDTQTNNVNRELSKGVHISNVDARGNKYRDVDIEQANNVRVSNVSCSSAFMATGSYGCIYENIVCSGFYAGTGDDVTIRNMKISPKGDVTNVFYIEGDRCDIDHVIIYDTANTYAGATFKVLGENVSIKNVTIENGNNTFEANCETCENISVVKGNNRLRTVNGVTVPTNQFYVKGGRIFAIHSSVPANGNVGDVVINSEPRELGSVGAKYIIDKWVRTESNWVECRTATGN